MILLIAISALVFTAWRIWEEQKLKPPRYESDLETWRKKSNQKTD